MSLNTLAHKLLKLAALENNLQVDADALITVEIDLEYEFGLSLQSPVTEANVAALQTCIDAWVNK